MERAEKLKKEAVGDISTIEELNEVKKNIKETEGEIESIEKAEKRMNDETWAAEEREIEDLLIRSLRHAVLGEEVEEERSKRGQNQIIGHN